MFEELGKKVKSAQKIVILVANNPDADSVGSALALAQTFRQFQKEVFLYCAINIPVYLHFLEEYHLFGTQLPHNYDLAIMVDNSAVKLMANQDIVTTIESRPLIILDHHLSEGEIKAELSIVDSQMAATGELIYKIAQALKWPLNQMAATYLAASISGDTLGFSSKVMTNNPNPLRVMAELVALGADLHDLAQKRLKWQQLPAHLIAYKGELYKRIEFYENAKIALLTIPHEEIKTYGLTFNPTIVLDEMRFVEGSQLTLGFKQYLDNKSGQLKRLTLRIRCHDQAQIALELAEIFWWGRTSLCGGG